MPAEGSGELGGPLRVAELAGSVCLATDLGMGFPWEHGLQATLAAMRLCDLLAVDDQTRREVYYVSLLFYSGCTSTGQDDARIFHGAKHENVVPYIWGTLPESLRGLLRALPDPDAGSLTRLGQQATGLARAALVLREQQRAYCDVAESLSTRLGLPASICGLFYFLTDRWDDSGMLGRASGEDIPRSVRIAFVARDAAYLREMWGAEQTRDVMRARGGRAHDPVAVDALMGDTDGVFAAMGSATSWADVMEAEPSPVATLAERDVDCALAAIGDFADLISPSLSGHSAGVSWLAGQAAGRMGMDRASVTRVRRAGLVQDVGRVGVDAQIWEKPTALTADENEKVRLHPYHTERVLSASPFLADLAPLSACHHERLDGSGYHRGLQAAALGQPARLLAVAEQYRALTSPRPHRPALPEAQAAQMLVEDVSSGTMDAAAVEAVLEVAGEPVGALARPAGLTPRETQVLGLLARGLATKQVARTLGISAKTADRHVQNSYHKIGVSSRAGATMFAMEHGLVAWGELPIGEPRAPS